MKTKLRTLVQKCEQQEIYIESIRPVQVCLFKFTYIHFLFFKKMLTHCVQADLEAAKKTIQEMKDTEKSREVKNACVLEFACSTSPLMVVLIAFLFFLKKRLH